jgi:hypothetical protein
MSLPCVGWHTDIGDKSCGVDDWSADDGQGRMGYATQAIDLVAISAPDTCVGGM